MAKGGRIPRERLVMMRKGFAKGLIGKEEGDWLLDEVERYQDLEKAGEALAGLPPIDAKHQRGAEGAQYALRLRHEVLAAVNVAVLAGIDRLGLKDVTVEEYIASLIAVAVKEAIHARIPPENFEALSATVRRDVAKFMGEAEKRAKAVAEAESVVAKTDTSKSKMGVTDEQIRAIVEKEGNGKDEPQ